MKRYANEAGLQRAVVKAVVKRWPGSWVFHPAGCPVQSVGIPDLLMCVMGRFVGLELKNPRGGESDDAARRRTTPRQQYHLDGIARAGGISAVAISVEEAVALIEAGLDNQMSTG